MKNIQCEAERGSTKQQNRQTISLSPLFKKLWYQSVACEPPIPAVST